MVAENGKQMTDHPRPRARAPRWPRLGTFVWSKEHPSPGLTHSLPNGLSAANRVRHLCQTVS